MASDRSYGIVHRWAEREGWWTNTAMVRELLDELERDRRENVGILQLKRLLDGLVMDGVWERPGYLDHIVEEMKRDVWLRALNLGWIPLELPQVEKTEETLFGREGMTIAVSVQCNKRGG